MSEKPLIIWNMAHGGSRAEKQPKLLAKHPELATLQIREANVEAFLSLLSGFLFGLFFSGGGLFFFILIQHP